MTRPEKSLEETIASYGIKFHGALSTSLGDRNLDYLIKKILKYNEEFVEGLKKMSNNPFLSESQQFGIVNILEASKQSLNKKVIAKLEAMKTGQNRPLLPAFRNYTTYYGKHVVFIVNNDEDVEQEWKSAVTSYNAIKHSSTGINGSKYNLYSFQSAWKESSRKKNWSARGHEWLIEKDSTLVLSHEELTFFKKQSPEIEFIKIWLANSLESESLTIESFCSLLDKPLQNPQDIDVRAASQELIKLLRPKNTIPRKLNMGDEKMIAIANNIQLDLSKPLPFVQY